MKNRFAEPLFNGYRDALYSVRVSSGDISHVCELQLHLAAVIAHKEKTHHYYEWRRRAEPNLPIAAMACWWGLHCLYAIDARSRRRRRCRERVHACVDGVDAMPRRLHAVDVASCRCRVASTPSM